MAEAFKDRSVAYSLRDGVDTLLPVLRTTAYEIEAVRFIENKLWQSMLQSLKSIPNLENF